MTEKTNIKNYYEILQVPQNSSLFQIEKAYQKLATKWHPDKYKEDKKLAERRFHDISQAYDVLSDRTRRIHYDELLQKKFNMDDAQSTFQKFFNENGVKDEREKDFFAKYYPQKVTDHYKVLGVPRTATLEDIKQAYRRLAIRYHPKNNPNNEDAKKKFIQINQAYNALSDQVKRKTYDDWVFDSFTPTRAYDVFDDFWADRVFDQPDEEQFFRPMIRRKISRNNNQPQSLFQQSKYSSGLKGSNIADRQNANSRVYGGTTFTSSRAYEPRRYQQQPSEYVRQQVPSYTRVQQRPGLSRYEQE